MQKKENALKYAVEACRNRDYDEKIETGNEIYDLVKNTPYSDNKYIPNNTHIYRLFRILLNVNSKQLYKSLTVKNMKIFFNSCILPNLDKQRNKIKVVRYFLCYFKKFGETDQYLQK